VAGIFSVNRQPFRCVEVDPERITVDLGHPLADKPIRVTATLIDTIEQKKEERGGLLRDWMEIMADGVGMQARWQDRPTDFFRDSPFARPDENVDARFYAQPRLVQHLDDVALEQVRQVYAQVIKEDMRVLDLMSSWHSHLPPGVRLRQVTGLGLNAHELQKNSALTDYQVHDLNNNPTLPFRDNHYDVIVCCVSVEYLTAPFDVFAEAARVLRPGGHLLTVFSNRWFPPKAVRIWTELHEFERMGLVLEYFHRSQTFSNLQTYSIRGLMRPRHDKYYAQMPFSDPVFAVWGQKVQS
jgi:hypothetical protein